MNGREQSMRCEFGGEALNGPLLCCSGVTGQCSATKIDQNVSSVSKVEAKVCMGRFLAPCGIAPCGIAPCGIAPCGRSWDKH